MTKREDLRKEFLAIAELKKSENCYQSRLPPPSRKS
jgi:hypothetical protein